MKPKCKKQNNELEDLKSELIKCFKNIKDLPSGDLNNFIENGIYWYNSGLSNIPGDPYGILFVISSPAGTKNNEQYWWTIQIAFSTNDSIWLRHSTDGTSWSAWKNK